MFDVIPIYDFTILSLCDVISAWYIMLSIKHFPSNGQSFTLLQLHWAEVGVSFHNNLWLWLEIDDLMFSMHE